MNTGHRHHRRPLRTTRVVPFRLRGPARLLLAAGVCAAAVPSQADARQAGGAGDPLPPDAEAAMEAFQEEHGIPGLVVGFTGPAGREVVALGSADSDGSPLRPDTRFELGSVTKVFTSLLLAEMTVQGDVALDDPIAAHLRGVELEEGTGALALHRLSTHTSGLPRLPANLAPPNVLDPYAGYGREELGAYLAGHDAGASPPGIYEYSNLGAGLLGEILADAGGAELGELLDERVLAPLGLEGTCLPEHAGCDVGMAEGHNASGVAPPWHFDALAGAGALRSTAGDLLSLVEHQIEPGRSPLDAAIRLSQEPRAEGPGGLELALAWHVAPLPDGTRAWFHNGGTGGFRSFVAFAPQHELGVVILANRDAPLPAVDELGLRLLLDAIDASGG